MATPNSSYILGVCALLFGPLAHADPPASPGPPRLLWTFGAQTRPVGLLARADLLSSRAALSLGAHAAYKSVSLELGVGPSLYALGGFLTFSVRAVLEPGFFLALPPNASLAQGRALSDPSDRTPGMRYGLSANLGINLRTGRLWLYHRATGWARARLSPEYDRIADAYVDDEFSLEMANAVMVDLWPRGSSRHLWLYAEHTHAWLYGTGTVVARPSLGFIAEEVFPRVAFDLDVNFGLRDGPLYGLGFILVAWIASE